MATPSCHSSRGQILVETLGLALALASLLIFLGVFLKKSHRTFQSQQFKEAPHERKIKVSPSR
jgi:hypothetical protein